MYRAFRDARRARFAIALPVDVLVLVLAKGHCGLVGMVRGGGRVGLRRRSLPMLLLLRYCELSLRLIGPTRFVGVSNCRSRIVAPRPVLIRPSIIAGSIPTRHHHPHLTLSPAPDLANFDVGPSPSSQSSSSYHVVPPRSFFLLLPPSLLPLPLPSTLPRLEE